MIDDGSGNFQNRRLVSFDSKYAFSGEEPRLIDEWQEIPSLWDATRSEVDKSRENGRFILTGSSTPVWKGIMHSAAGRIGRIQMRTMSLYESGDSDGSVPLLDLFDGSFESCLSETASLETLIDLTVRGGWPRNLGRSAEQSLAINTGYLDTCIEDACRLDGSARNRAKVEMVMRSLARNESTVASIDRIQSDVREGTVSDNAIAHYLDVFRRIFLINDQPSFSPNYRSPVRVGKAVKRHLADPSLAVAALRMTPKKLLNDLNTFGFLFEALCERDLDIYARSIGGRQYHYRDGAGREIDSVIELDDGRWGAFEIKLGASQIDAAAENLLKIDSYIRERADNPPSTLCVICGICGATYRRPDGVYVVPITSLRGVEIPGRISS